MAQLRKTLAHYEQPHVPLEQLAGAGMTHGFTGPVAVENVHVQNLRRAGGGATAEVKAHFFCPSRMSLAGKPTMRGDGRSIQGPVVLEGNSWAGLAPGFYRIEPLRATSNGCLTLSEIPGQTRFIKTHELQPVI